MRFLLFCWAIFLIWYQLAMWVGQGFRVAMIMTTVAVACITYGRLVRRGDVA